MKTPNEIKSYESDYKPDAWKEYSLVELGMWVHLLHKRAGMRSDPKKREKDLWDARNYWSMMGAWLDADLSK